jgi:hypothetical protein
MRWMCQPRDTMSCAIMPSAMAEFLPLGSIIPKRMSSRIRRW